MFHQIYWRKCSFPYNLCKEVTFAKNLITDILQVLLLIIINRNKNHTILTQQRTSHHQSRIHHRAPIRMKTSIRIHVLDIFIAQFIHCPRSFSILIGRHGIVIMINKVIPRVVRWIDIDHLHLTQI